MRMLLWLALALVIYLIWKLISFSPPRISSPRGGTAKGGASGGKRVIDAGDMVKDPVCNTYIPAGNSITENIGGQTYHFCSPQCRDKFLKSQNKS
ncbi:MAG: YHS domain-containing protein [Candidatus Aminicenantes bacterium]|nr:YHS domain-containing protein [Candidatus Aminicenantes bacterium]MDH5714616.1 YHS domain-containing protein [Candidatus Aminicenantes bacterium]